MLALKNPHPRDVNIEFFEGPHLYVVNKDPTVKYTSVTTFNGQHFNHFDAEKIVEGILNNPRWEHDETYVYFQKPKQEILSAWEKNGKCAAEAGTKTHFHVECFYNDVFVEDESKEFQFFKNFVADFPELKPFRTEWVIYDEDLRISGSIDMLFEREDGSLEIYDWKRCKNLGDTNCWGRYANTKCIRHVPDTKIGHYSLQLNLYKTILERKYGKTIHAMYLVGLHPDQENYLRIPAPEMKKEMEALMKFRMEQIAEEKKGTSGSLWIPPVVLEKKEASGVIGDLEVVEGKKRKAVDDIKVEEKEQVEEEKEEYVLV